MTAPNVQPDAPDRERRRAADLRTGDRIVPNLLDPAAVEEVIGVHPYTDGYGVQWVCVVYRDDRPGVFFHYFRAEGRVALAAAAEPDLPTDVEGVAPGAAIGRATVPTEPVADECGWMTPSGPCHLIRDHPLFPFGPREDSGHISEASAAANRARLAARENTST